MLKQIAYAAVSLILLTSCADAAGDKTPADSQTRPQAVDMKAQVREILKENPEIILDALRENKKELFDIVEQGLAEKREDDRQKQIEESMKNRKQPEVGPERLIKGDADAPVTIVEYSDFLCPYCAKAAQAMNELVDKRPDQVRVVFKHIPLHKWSKELALHFEALGRQDPKMAWTFHDMAFARAKEISEKGEPAITAIVADIPGVDLERLNQDLGDAELEKRIAADVAEAKRFGISGTPVFLVDGVMVKGAAPVEHFEEIIDKVAPAEK